MAAITPDPPPAQPGPGPATTRNRKTGRGQDTKEELRALKRQGQQRIRSACSRCGRAADRVKGPREGAGERLCSQRAGCTPGNRLFGQALPGPVNHLRPHAREHTACPCQAWGAERTFPGFPCPHAVGRSRQVRRSARSERGRTTWQGVPASRPHPATGRPRPRDAD